MSTASAVALRRANLSNSCVTCPYSLGDMNFQVSFQRTCRAASSEIFVSGACQIEPGEERDAVQ